MTNLTDDAYLPYPENCPICDAEWATVQQQRTKYANRKPYVEYWCWCKKCNSAMFYKFKEDKQKLSTKNVEKGGKSKDKHIDKKQKKDHD